MPRPVSSLERLRIAVIPCIGVFLVSCREGVLDPQGPVSSAERLILLNATGIMLVVALPVIVMTFVFAWWYRASNRRAVYRPNWSYSGQVELVVWAIPSMVVLLLAGVAWIGAHQLDPRVKLEADVKPLRIQVVSLDWKWLFIYADQHIATVNQLVVPTGTPLEFELTAATVMNAFFIPQLGSQIYTMPGMTTHLNLLAERAGEYPGLSSHFSGSGFSDMRFEVRAVSPADFRDWLGSVRSAGPPLDSVGYERLAGAGSNVPAQTFGRVDPTLFQHILVLAAPRGISPAKEH